MRRLVTLGVSSLLVGLAFTGCGDDEDGGGTGARGGSAGTGVAGTGMAGAGMGGGSSGTGGTPGTGGSGGATGAACPGCARITAPFTAANQGLSYQVYFNPPVDMSNTTFTWRVRVNSFAGTSGGIQLFAQNNGGTFPEATNYSNYTNIADLVGDGFVDLSVNIGALPGIPAPDGGVADAGGDAGAPPAFTVFDKSQVGILTFQLISGGAATGFATAEVDIDSLTFSDQAGLNRTFSAAADIAPPGLNPNNPADDPTGATIVYVAQ